MPGYSIMPLLSSVSLEMNAMRDLTLFLAFIVAVLLAYQAKPSASLPASRTAKVRLNDADLAVCVFTITLAILMTAMALSV